MNEGPTSLSLEAADVASLRAQWRQAFERSPLRMLAGDSNGPLAIAGAILDALAESSPLTDLSPGSSCLREAEKSAAFAGARLGATDATGFEVAALLGSLRDVIIARARADSADIARLFEWLAAVALDAFATGRAGKVIERARDDLERGIPVVLIDPELPAALLCAHADDAIADSAMARLLLLIARVGARCAVIDVGGVAEAAHGGTEAAIARFVGHRKIAAGVAIAFSGAWIEAESRWRAASQAAGGALHFCDRFDAALAWARQLARARP